MKQPSNLAQLRTNPPILVNTHLNVEQDEHEKRWTYGHEVSMMSFSHHSFLHICRTHINDKPPETLFVGKIIRWCTGNIRVIKFMIRTFPLLITFLQQYIH